MVFICPIHREQSIDDACPECEFQSKAPKLKRMRQDIRFFSKKKQYLCLLNGARQKWAVLYYDSGWLCDLDETFTLLIEEVEEIYEIQ